MRTFALAVALSRRLHLLHHSEPSPSPLDTAPLSLSLSSAPTEQHAKSLPCSLNAHQLLLCRPPLRLLTELINKPPRSFPPPSQIRANHSPISQFLSPRAPLANHQPILPIN